jgi:hypothetical protein
VTVPENRGKAVGRYTALDGFVLRKIMTAGKTSQIASSPQPGFSIVCNICNGLGIVFDCSEQAPSSTPIKCRHCGASRGTLGDLRSLSRSDRHDLFEF